MPSIIFSFDTEDYINPETDDFTHRICEIFSDNGLRASFMVVGERARVLIERGRLNVIQALKRHEIGYHSYFHSMHPNVAEYLDQHGWSDGLAEFLSREHEGVGLVQEIFDRDRLWAAVPAGSSWGPQMVYGYAQLGIPIQSGTVLSPRKNHPYHYIGQMHLDYNLPLDSLLLDHDWKQIQTALERKINDGVEYIVTVSHPTILLHRKFVDSLNFGQGQNHRMGHWLHPEKRSLDKQNHAMSNLDRLLKFVKDHPELTPSSYEEVYERFRESHGGRITRSNVVALAAQTCEELARSVELAGMSLSAADQFGLLNYAVAHSRHGTLPDEMPLRRLLGPTEPIVDLERPIEVASAKVQEAAAITEHRLRRHVPHTIEIDGHLVGPGTFFKGLAQIVTGATATPFSVCFEPTPQFPVEAEMDGLRDLTWKGRWDIFAPDFAGENLQRHAKLQTWTIRPAITHGI